MGLKETVPGRDSVETLSHRSTIHTSPEQKSTAWLTLILQH